MPETPSEADSLTLQDLMEFGRGMMLGRTLNAAVKLNVFGQLSGDFRSAEEVSRALRTDPRATRMLLDALAALRLLTKESSRYRNEPIALRYLDPASDDYIGERFAGEHQWEAWAQLDESVRTGWPYRRVEQKEKAEDYFPALVRSLHHSNRDQALRLADHLGSAGSLDGKHALDVACGSGVWSISLAEKHPGLRVTAHDFPAILEITRDHASRHGVADRFDYLPGDLAEVDFGEDRFNLAILGHIVHSEGAEKSSRLFARIHRALHPGGRIVIIDMVPNATRTAPPFPVLFALNMLVNTEQGDTFTLDEYRAWLTEAGFAAVETGDIGSHSPVIMARKQ